MTANVVLQEVVALGAGVRLMALAPWGYAVGSVVLISLAALAGALALPLGRERLEQVLFLLVSFAVGALFGGALLHLIPESYGVLGDGPQTGLLVIAGVAAFFVLEKFLHWRHDHGGPGEMEGFSRREHTHAMLSERASSEQPEPFAVVNLVGSAVHHVIDGAIVAAAYLVSVEAGLVTTLAVMLHEIPQQIGNFGVLVYGGLAPRRALLYNFGAGLAGLLGAGGVLGLGSSMNGVAGLLLPVTAGSFLYIAGSDLIPELNRRGGHSAARAAAQLAMILLGAAVMAVPFLLGGSAGHAH